MHLEGNVSIDAPRQKVWESLTDPYFVVQCAPGLESMDVIEPNKRFQAVAGAGFGSIKVTFKTDVEWLELDAPTHASMKVHGTAPGSAMDMTSAMNLIDGPDGSTELNWTAEIVVLGTIASVAARLMHPVANLLVGTLFKCIKGKIEGTDTSNTDAAAVDAPVEDVAHQDPAQS
jgi:carbon monoxide dehydrogenase subunit G